MKNNKIFLLAMIVITHPFLPLLASSPGQWVSIGPNHVHAPALPNHVPPLGEYNAVGRLTTIAIDPTNPQIIYVGSPGELGHEGSGVWKTTNGGTTWTPITDGLPTLAVAAIAIDPTNHNRIYIATADHGLYRSDDAGAHWIHVYASDLHVRTNTSDGDHTALLINPASPNILYLSTDDGVLRSDDSGQNWATSLNGPFATNLVMDPLNPNILYAGILGKGVYKTVTGGIPANTSWQLQNQAPLPSPIPSIRGPLLAISHPAGDAHETTYAMYPNYPTAGAAATWQLFRTTDGTTWNGPLYSCSVEGPPPCVFFVIAADPQNKNRVFIAGPPLLISEIGVTPFTSVPPINTNFCYNDRQPDSPHGDYWEIVFDPTNSANVFAGSDGGIFRSTNYGATGSWSFIGDGITNVEMYDLAQAATQLNLVLAGTQDNGNILYTGSLMWDHIPHDQECGGDGGLVAIDPTNANTLYAMGQVQDTLSQSTTLDPSFVPFNNGLPSSQGTNCAAYNSSFHFQIDPSTPTTLLASCGLLWRTTTNVAPGDWNAFYAPAPADGKVVRTAVEKDNHLYYVGTDAGNLFAVFGLLQFKILSHLNSQNVSDIEIDPAHQDTGYVSFAPPFTVDRPCPSTSGQSRIYQFKRLTPLPNVTFSSTDITGNLQSTGLCVNSIAIDPHIPRTLYAATNRGVYRGMENATGGPWVWEQYNNGMPLADVRDLEVHPVTGNIDAATYGRSAFELIPETIVSVGIDIKPGTTDNVIKLKSTGKIPVAILSSATFDAPNQVNRNSLRFGRTGNETSLAICNTVAQDVNGDGLLDQICHFYTSLTGFQTGDSEGILKGQTTEGTPIEGSDSVRIMN